MPYIFIDVGNQSVADTVLYASLNTKSKRAEQYR